MYSFLHAGESQPRREGSRRLLGFLSGTGLGILYGLSSQSINLLSFPGIPFHQPPFGISGNILTAFMVGCLTGLATCWAQSSIKGIFTGSVVAAGFMQLSTLITGLNGPEVLTGKLLSIVFLLPPSAAMLLPVIFIFRLGVAWQVEAGAFRFSQRGSRVLLLLFLAAAGIGGLARYPEAARQPLEEMNRLIRTSREISTAEQLPPEIRPPDVEGFLRQSRGAYGLT